MKWKKRLERIIEIEKTSRKFLTPSYYNSCEDANNWSTCAIGENKERLKKLGYRFDKKGPLNPHLVMLGMKFLESIENDQHKEALTVLGEIQAIKKPEKED